MTEAERLRAQAERCLQAARQTIGETSRQFQTLADEFLERALRLEQGQVGQQVEQGQQPPPVPPQQQQPAQLQQQIQLKAEEEE
jgi:hypothetical protein